jgi:hypothetical protein
MQNIPRTSVYDFIYNTIGGNQYISVIGGDAKYIDEPFYEGTPNDLFSNHSDIARELKSWTVNQIWAESGDTIVITCEGGKTTNWLSEYGRDPKGWYEKEQERLFGPDWKEKYGSSFD